MSKSECGNERRRVFSANVPALSKSHMNYDRSNGKNNVRYVRLEYPTIFTSTHLVNLLPSYSLGFR